MHRARMLLLLCVLSPIANICHAQTVMLDLPLQSQHAVVMQRIGVTDITVNYRWLAAAKSGTRLCLMARSGAPGQTKIPRSLSPIRLRLRASRSIKELMACT